MPFVVKPASSAAKEEIFPKLSKEQLEISLRGRKSRELRDCLYPLQMVWVQQFFMENSPHCSAHRMFGSWNSTNVETRIRIHFSVCRKEKSVRVPIFFMQRPMT
jgi:hypothetical protein